MRRRAIIGNQMILPAGYEKLEYIQNNNSGYQSIHTDFIPNLNTTIKIDMMPLEATGAYNSQYIIFLGSRSTVAGSTPQACFYLQLHNSHIMGTTAPHTYRNDGVTVAYGDRIQVEFKSEYVSVNGNTNCSPFNNTDVLMSTSPLWLFNINDSQGFGTQNRLYYRIYSCEIYGNTGHLKLIPCKRKSDNKIGMYDVINNKFYTNAGTGEFIGG